jgi:hypothetical protein
MESIVINDFSAGWTPEDDPINGRKNGLLKMNSVELDQNGAVRMSGGIKNLFATNYPANAHTLYSKFIGAGQQRYLALTNGAIYRNETEILSGGSITRAAFGSAFNFVIICSGSLYKKDTGASLSNLGINPPAVAPTVATGNPGGTLLGTYEYAQVHVAKFNNAYVAKSPMGMISVSIDANNESILVTPRAPALDDTQATETWIFRRGGTLDDWYRIRAMFAAAPFDDNISDQDAATLNIKSNIHLINISSIEEAVLAMAGPVNGRMIYFSESSIYISEINSIDSIDSRFVISFTGVGTEIFLWAIKLTDNGILVGTTLDVYLLSGTFRTLADGTIDAYLEGLSVDSPPISIDVAKYQGNVIYMAADGWKMFSPGSAGSIPLCAATSDRLYRGERLHDYGGVPIYPYPITHAGEIPRYSCVVARNKLWTRVPILQENFTAALQSRVEVYDFVRKYWRVLPISPTLLWDQEDDAVLAFFDDATGKNLREIDNQFQKLNEGAVKQIVTLRGAFQDKGQIKNRKDFLSIRLRCYTGNDPTTLHLYRDGSFSDIVTTLAFTNDTLEEKFIDLSSVANLQGVKNVAWELTGPLADFLLTDISLDFEPYPEPLVSYKVKGKNLGPNKKRLRTQPFLIDTRGANVIVTPYIDGVQGAIKTINTSSKRTAFYFFTTDVYGVDYDFDLLTADPNNPFELWEVHQPEIVQVLPVAKKFDQIGPTEMFRWGKLKTLELRLIAFNSTAHGNIMPYTLYFEDTFSASSSFAIYDSKEAVYPIPMPKTTHGEVIRIELGPTEYDFHRLYTRIQVAKSNDTTDLRWLTLEEASVQ